MRGVFKELGVSMKGLILDMSTLRSLLDNLNLVGSPICKSRV